MDRSDALSQIRDVMTSELGVVVDEITEKANLKDDLELDSIDLVELVATLEDRIGESIDENSLGKIRTVADVIDIVAEKTFDKTQPSTAS